MLTVGEWAREGVREAGEATFGTTGCRNAICSMMTARVMLALRMTPLAPSPPTLAAAVAAVVMTTGAALPPVAPPHTSPSPMPPRSVPSVGS